MDRKDPPHRIWLPVDPVYGLTLPLAVLVIVVAVVSGLVFGGVVQGDATRVTPTQPPTTQSTILIAP